MNKYSSMQWIRKTPLFLLVIGLGFALSSCYPEEVNSYSELDLVFTNYDDGYDFDGITTYFLPDSVMPEIDENGDPIDGNTQNDAFIIGQIASQLNDLGLVRVTDTTGLNFDVAFLASKSSQTTVVYWYNYWYGFWGWYPGYYPGWGYPSYTTYETGSVIINMYDPKEYDGDTEVVPVRWVGIANGLLNKTSNQTLRNRISIAMEKMFNEFPSN